MLDETENSLLLTTFSSGMGKIRLAYQNNSLLWDNARPPYAQNTLSIRDVIFVERMNSKTKSASRQFKICYVEPKSKNRYDYKFWTLTHSDSEVVTLWVASLKKFLQSLFYRPKKLLLFVNPFGGKKNGMSIYEKIAKPLFKLASVDVTVIVSQNQNQIFNVLLSYNLDVYDAVGCLGGDGTFSEVLNGLVWKECNKLGLDPNDSNITLPKPKIPVGIIPGGSTDQTAYCVYGTTDQKTAVLQIILGYSVGLDILSVYSNDNLLRLCADVLSYGYLGDIVHFSEQFRWMGPTRYQYTGFRKIVQNTGYDGSLSMLLDLSEYAPSKCYENCQSCSEVKSGLPNGNPVEYTWKTISGKFFMISGANISCAGKHSPDGISPYSHLGDGFLYLVLVHHTSFLRSLKILNRITSSNYGLDDLPEVSVYRAKEFNFMAQDAESRWNCDGEVIHNSNIHAKVNCQLLTVFGRGIRKPKQ